jgi:predicted PurR-regulated permease PerM
LQNQIDGRENAAATVATNVTWYQTRVVLRIIIVILLVAAGLWMLYALKDVILLVVLSIFFAYLIAPLVEFMSRSPRLLGLKWSIPRSITVGIVYLLLAGSLFTVLYIAMPRIWGQITSFFQQAPIYITSARERAKGLSGLYDRLDVPEKARVAINDALTKEVGIISQYTGEQGLGLAGDQLRKLVSYAPWLFLIPILAFFFLKDVDSFRRSALQMLPRGRWRWRGDEFFQDVNSTLAAYIRAQLSACVIIGLICTLGFLLLGVPYWLALGVFAGFLEFIPLAGPLVVAILAIFLAVFHSLGSALLVMIFLAVLRILEDYVIYPRLIGQGIHLHPLAVILAILSGAELAGVAGIFLAIPVIAITTVSYRHWLEHRGSEGLVADMLRPTGEAVGTPSVPAKTSRNDSGTGTVVPDELTPEEMAVARPDLTTGELRMPDE